VARRKNRKLRKWVYWMRLRPWWWIYNKFIVGKPQSSHLTYFFMRSLPIGVWCAFDDSKWLCVEEMWQKITNSSQIQKTTSCLDVIVFVFCLSFVEKASSTALRLLTLKWIGSGLFTQKFILSFLFVSLTICVSVCLFGGQKVHTLLAFFLKKKIAWARYVACGLILVPLPKPSKYYDCGLVSVSNCFLFWVRHKPCLRCPFITPVAYFCFRWLCLSRGPEGG